VQGTDTIRHILVEPPLRYLSRLAVKTSGKVYLLQIDEIDWVETAGNYVRIHVGPMSHLYRDSLLNFESKLDPHRFVKIHRSTVVHIDRIAQLEPTFRREHIVTLRDGTRLIMTAPYRSRLEAIVGTF
jgi:two-component system LytT family response regulator